MGSGRPPVLLRAHLNESSHHVTTRTRLLLALGTTVLLGAAPVATAPWAFAHPVAPTVHTFALTGVDSRAAATSPPARDPAQLRSATSTAPPAAPRRVAATTRPAVLSSAVATGRFSAAGVSWANAGAPRGVVVQVRVLENGAWGDWQQLEPEGGPDAGTAEAKRLAGRVSTEPVTSGDGTSIQVRVDTLDGTAPRDLRLLTVDPGASPADANPAGTPASTAQGSTTRPAIITRAQWGADESLRDCAPSYSPTIKVGFVHHTVGSNTYSAAESAGIVRGIYAYHVKGNGWCDVGYNFLVDRFGQTFEGRAGGMDLPVLGAHTLAFNYNSFGVAGMGTFDTTAPPAAMLASMTKVLGWKLGMHLRDPRLTQTLRSAGGPGARWPVGTLVSFVSVSGHRDAYSTDCPGQLLYNQLPTLRQDAAFYQYGNTTLDQNLYGTFGTTTYAPTGKVEIHGVSRASGYADRMVDAATSWSAGKPDEWRFLIGSSQGDSRPDLIGVHTKNTSSGKVEVRVASWASNYRDTVVANTTPLSQFTPDATAQLAVGGPSGGDLYYILLQGGGSKTVEVHSLTAASGYTDFRVHSSTALATSYPSANARFLVGDGPGDLYLVLHQNTGSRQSELHMLTAASNYQTFSAHARLPKGYTDDSAVQWVLGNGPTPDLLAVLLTDTGTKQVEAHTLSRASGFGSWTGHSPTGLPMLGYPGWQFGVG